MIPGRISTLIAAYEVYKKYGTLLILKVGEHFYSCGSCDDPGYFLYIPLLSSFLKLSVMQSAQLLTIIISIGLFLTFMFLSLTIQPSLKSGFLTGCITFLFCFKLSTIVDVYIAQAAVFSPIALFFIGLYKKSRNWLYISSFLIGLIGQFGSLIRGYSIVPVLVLWGIILFFCSVFSKKQKFIACILLIIGYCLVNFHYHYSLNKRDAFLISQGASAGQDSRHVFWHNMYIGLGFISNNYDIHWDDACADNAIKKIDPKCGVGSDEGEAITKQLLLNLFKKDRHFVLTSLFARFGVVIMFFLLWFGWLGLLCSYFYLKPWYIELGFIAALGVSALPGILTIPNCQYLVGFITCTVLYTIYSIVFAFNNGLEKDLKKYYEKAFYYRSNI